MIMQDRYGEKRKTVRVYNMGRIAALTTAVSLVFCAVILFTSRPPKTYIVYPVDFYIAGNSAFLDKDKAENYAVELIRQGEGAEVNKISSKQYLYSPKNKKQAEEINELFLFPKTVFITLRGYADSFLKGDLSAEFMYKALSVYSASLRTFAEGIPHVEHTESAEALSGLYGRLTRSFGIAVGAFSFENATVSTENTLYVFAFAYTGAA